MFYSNIKWDIRYPPNWHELRAKSHRLTGGVCCLCKKTKSTTVHHTRYRHKKDTPGINLFPLCDKCHTIAHSSKNWVKHKGNPLWKNRNKDIFEIKLQQNFRALKRQK
jgi:hypothetical protein